MNMHSAPTMAQMSFPMEYGVDVRPATPKWRLRSSSSQVPDYHRTWDEGIGIFSSKFSMILVISELYVRGGTHAFLDISDDENIEASLNTTTVWSSLSIQTLWYHERSNRHRLAGVTFQRKVCIIKTWDHTRNICDVFHHKPCPTEGSIQKSAMP